MGTRPGRRSHTHRTGPAGTGPDGTAAGSVPEYVSVPRPLPVADSVTHRIPYGTGGA
jgi:hypothetical protein